MRGLGTSALVRGLGATLVKGLRTGCVIEFGDQFSGMGTRGQCSCMGLFAKGTRGQCLW